MSQKLVLTLLEGPRRGQVYVVNPGERATVGRSHDMAIRIDDNTVSRRHAEIVWTGTIATLTDLGSAAGVWVNGTAVTQATLCAGDRLQFGRALLSVAMVSDRRRIVDGATNPQDVLPPVQSPDQPPAVAGVVGMLKPLTILADVEPTLRDASPIPAGDVPLVAGLSALQADWPDARLWAIVDGAQAYEVAFTARLMGRRIYTLFSGELAVALSHVGPCLIDLDVPASFLQLWMTQLGAHAGILIQTRAPLEQLYQHLRDSFVATDESGQEYFFRYYDPRVLRTFLPTCTVTELEEFFGPVLAWIAEDAAGTGFVASLRRDGGLVQTPVVLLPHDNPAPSR